MVYFWLDLILTVPTAPLNNAYHGGTSFFLGPGVVNEILETAY